MLVLFNTLTGIKEIFQPSGDVVGIYTCGPSVYQEAHIGNFRTFIFEDVLVRYLRFKGFKVKRVMNLTDIEDKAITAAGHDKKALIELTQYYSNIFFKDMDSLNLIPADVFPRATENISEMIDIIKKIMKNGYAYRGHDGSIYYDISSFKNYGELSHLKLKTGKKKIKRDEWGEDTLIVSDFALWKSYEKDDGDIFWETELGKGRPGWHIECSAMCTKYLGTHFDMHIGGRDNIFPHHENVLAQNFGAFGINPSRYWLHCKHLLVEGKKMSKSENNFITLRDLTKNGWSPMAVRYLLLTMSYRRRLNFTIEGLNKARMNLEKLLRTIENLKKANGKDDAQKSLNKAFQRFEKAMDDNLNTGRGLKVIEEFVNEIGHMDPTTNSARQMLDFFSAIDSILGFGFFSGEKKIGNQKDFL